MSDDLVFNKVFGLDLRSMFSLGIESQLLIVDSISEHTGYVCPCNSMVLTECDGGDQDLQRKKHPQLR